MDEALLLACELEAFCFLDLGWGLARKLSEGLLCEREPDLFKAQMLRSDLQEQQQRQETQQDALRQLAQQIKQFTQSMSLNTSENQQRSTVPRHFSRNGPCWDSKEFGLYCCN